MTNCDTFLLEKSYFESPPSIYVSKVVVKLVPVPVEESVLYTRILNLYTILWLNTCITALEQNKTRITYCISHASFYVEMYHF